MRLAIEIRASIPNTEQNSAFVDTFVCHADTKWYFDMSSDEINTAQFAIAAFYSFIMDVLHS